MDAGLNLVLVVATRTICLFGFVVLCGHLVAWDRFIQRYLVLGHRMYDLVLRTVKPYPLQIFLMPEEDIEAGAVSVDSVLGAKTFDLVRRRQFVSRL